MILRVGIRKLRLQRWRADRAFLGDQSQDRQGSHHLTAWGSHGATLSPTLFSAAALVGASFPIQSKSHPLSLSGGYRALLLTEVLGMAPVHGLDQYGAWAGSSVVQCLSHICRALGSVLNTTTR